MKIGPDPHYDDGSNQGELSDSPVAFDAAGGPIFEESAPVAARPPWPRLELTDAVIQKNAVGHYYIVGYLPGGIRVAGWLHERPLPDAKEGENGTST